MICKKCRDKILLRNESCPCGLKQKEIVKYDTRTKRIIV